MSRGTSWPRTIFLVLLSIPFVYPFIFLATVALRTRNDYIRDPVGFPQEFTLEHVQRAWDNAGLGRALLNSVLVSSLSAIFLVAICTLGAYWFLRHRSRPARVLFYVLVGSWIIPLVIYVLPLFVTLSNFGLTDHLVILSVVYAGLFGPFGLYLIDAYAVMGVPREVREAARVDGVSPWQEFRLIFVPLVRPVAGTIVALGFVWAWGDLLVALVLIQSGENYPVTLAASTLGKSGFAGGPSGLQEGAAAAMIALLPLVLVFLVAQRAITRGMTAGFTR